MQLRDDASARQGIQSARKPKGAKTRVTEQLIIVVVHN